MSGLENSDSKILDRVIELVVSCIAFYGVCKLIAVDTGSGFYLHMIMYALVLVVSVSLSQRFFMSFESFGEISRYILANAVGILVGTAIVLISQSIVFNGVGYFAVVLFSSVIIFFVLGTISSIMRGDPGLGKS